MPRIPYIEKNFRGEALDMINKADTIATLYQAQGFDLTLRQMYYQFVSRNWLANNEKNYKKLGDIVADARLAGMIDWDHIVDRTREIEKNSHWANPAEIIDAVSRQYREDKWATQDTYVEVWIEKDALVGVLAAVCPQNDVTYFSCRGYTSASAIWQAAQRIGEQISKGKQAKIIHLGDHDPSGMDMSRDIEDRLTLFIAQDQFGASWYDGENDQDRKWAYQDAIGESLEINRIALNHDQVLTYNPPPNPAKLTDARAANYIRQFGTSSWELDALDPATLVALIQGTINEYKDPDVWQAAVDAEGQQRDTLKLVSRNWNSVVSTLEAADDDTEEDDAEEDDAEEDEDDD